MIDVFNRYHFCNILNNARSTGFSGAWSGSAFRDHPCGIVRGNLKMTNEWRVDNGCSIVITDGQGWNTADICRESCAYGNPHPKPVGGRSISVWNGYAWADDALREAIEPVARKILTDAMYHSIAQENWQTAINAQKQYAARVSHESAKRAAIAQISA